MLNGPLQELREPLQAHYKTIKLPLLPPPTREALQQMAAAGGPAGYNASFQLARLDQGLPLLEHIDYPIQSWRFGDQCGWVFLAGEVCVDYALRLRRELDGERLWLHGYANDFCAYIPSERLLKEGGYGGGGEIPYFALPNKFAPGLERPIIDEVKRQLPPSWRTPENEPGAATPGAPPRSPEQSAALMRVNPSLRIELAACEPVVVDPVAIDFAADGSLWVAEMSDYARPVDGEFFPTGRIKHAFDDDGDGRYERSILFAEGFRFPTDVKVWRDGVLVCDAPSIWFLKDNDGDGRADEREAWYTGFATHNPHARVNSLQWGLDGWVYGAGGLFGGDIEVSPNGPVVSVRDRDFRLLPDQRRIEPATGRTQQGRARNDWGQWFGCNNSQLVLHYPLHEHWLMRKRELIPPATVVAIESSADANQLYPRGELVRFKLSGPAGRATSACGLTVYRDDWLGPEYSNNAFVCEPVNQLVHRQILSRDGGSMRATRADSETELEFLTSTDQWFRPVQAKTGLDGGLWVVDMYRYVIEHPQWIPEETRAALNVMAGNDRGRIYRIVPREKGRREVPELKGNNIQEIAANIASANGPVRDLAQQLLVWNDGKQPVAPTLRSIAQTAPHPAARLQAFATLVNLKQATVDDARQAMHDDSADVRSAAIDLWSDWSDAGLRDDRRGLLADPAAQVRQAAAWSLAADPDPLAAERLLRALEGDAADPYLAAAYHAAMNGETAREVLRLAKEQPQRLAAAWMQPVLTTACAGDEPQRLDVVRLLVKDMPASPNEDDLVWRWRVLRSWLAVLDDGRRIALPKDVVNGIGRLRDVAAETLQQQVSATDAARAAIAVLAQPGLGDVPPDAAWADAEQARAALTAALQADRETTLQREALRGLSALSAAGTAEALVPLLDQSSPELHNAILDVLLDREAWTVALADYFAHHLAAWRRLDPARRGRLLRTIGANLPRELRETSVDLSQRTKELADFARRTAALISEHAADDPTATMEAKERGGQLFRKHCSACHRLGEVGNEVGPNLAALTVQHPHWWLTAMLEPNREWDQRYVEYLVQRKDGRLISGLLAEENGNALVLVQQDGQRVSLPRRDIEQLRNNGRSFMPEGFEKVMTPEEAADLLQFFLQDAPRPKSLEGNAPRLIEPGGDGVLLLPAASAEIYGESITFEIPFSNIGYWHGQQDMGAPGACVPRREAGIKSTRFGPVTTRRPETRIASTAWKTH